MLKWMTAFALTALLGYVAFLYGTALPWWAFALGAFAVGAAVPQSGWRSWLAGFAGMLVCWVLLTWRIDAANEGVMSARMAQVLPLGGSSGLLMVLSGLVAGLIGGFAALSGCMLRRRPRTA